LYVIDDVFASVDPSKRGRLWKECIENLLLRAGHGVVLTTNESLPPDILPWLENIVTVGEVVGRDRVGGSGVVDGSSWRSSVVALGVGEGFKDRASLLSQSTLPSIPSLTFPTQTAQDPQKKAVVFVEPKRAPLLDKKVFPSFGSVHAYFSAVGWLRASFLLGLFLSAQGVLTLQSFWLRAWASETTGMEASSSLPPMLAHLLNTLPPSSVYAILGGGYICLYGVGLLTLNSVTLSASSVMHKFALEGVLKCPLPVLESLSVGSILARFEGDVDHLDLWIRPNILYVLSALMAVGGVSLTFSLTQPLLLLTLAVLGLGYIGMGIVYKRVVLALRALDATTSSGLTGRWRDFTGCAAYGGAVIRVGGPRACAWAVRTLLEAQVPKITSSLAATAGASVAANCIYAVGCSILLVAAQLSVMLVGGGGGGGGEKGSGGGGSASLFYGNKESFTVGDAGLIITAAFAFPDAMKNLVVNLGWLETSAVSIARLHEYGKLLGEDEVHCNALRKGGLLLQEPPSSGSPSRSICLEKTDGGTAQQGGAPLTEGVPGVVLVLRDVAVRRGGGQGAQT